eukprot:g1689.t1
MHSTKDFLWIRDGEVKASYMPISVDFHHYADSASGNPELHDCLKSSKLSSLVVLSTLIVIFALTWFIVVVMGWPIGPIEVIALIVFIGYAVTYSLHIAHRYGSSDVAQEHDLAGHLSQLFFCQFLLSAVTTAGCSIFLVFCTLTIFKKLGGVVLVVTVMSIGVALIPLPAALLWFGPLRPGRCFCFYPTETYDNLLNARANMVENLQKRKEEQLRERETREDMKRQESERKQREKEEEDSLQLDNEKRPKRRPDSWPRPKPKPKDRLARQELLHPHLKEWRAHTQHLQSKHLCRRRAMPVAMHPRRLILEGSPIQGFRLVRKVQVDRFRYLLAETQQACQICSMTRPKRQSVAAGVGAAAALAAPTFLLPSVDAPVRAVPHEAIVQPQVNTAGGLPSTGVAIAVGLGAAAAATRRTRKASRALTIRRAEGRQLRPRDRADGHGWVKEDPDFNAADDSAVSATHTIELKKRPSGIKRYTHGIDGKGAMVMDMNEKAT